MQLKRMADKPYILEESLGYSLGRAARSLGARVNHNFTAASLDVTCEQWAIMAHLGKKNGLNQQELAGLTCKDKTSMTRLIDNMEKHSLVVRIPDKSDKRQKLIYLTKKGQDLQDRLVKVIQRSLQEAQKGISSKDLQICKCVLRKIYENAKL